MAPLLRRWSVSPAGARQAEQLSANGQNAASLPECHWLSVAQRLSVALRLVRFRSIAARTPSL